MWNKYLLILVALLLTNSLYSQKDSTDFRPSLHLGLQYGMSWNDVQFSPVIKQTVFLGQRLSLAARYTSEPHLGIQMELAYDKRGWTETRDHLSTSYSREIDYLELAAFTHISIGNRRIRPIILLGSFLSYPIGETENYPAEWMSEPMDAQIFYYGNKLPERLQFGLAGGLGFELIFGRSSFQFDGRYRSTLGGIFSTTESELTFSNSRGFVVALTGVYRL